MKKVGLIVFPLLLACVVFIGIAFYLNRQEGQGALQVTSVPKSKVYLDGKLLGETPLCKCDPSTMLQAGEYTIKLVPNQSDLAPFENKITITQSVLTVVDRTFGKGGFSEGSIISLTPLENKNGVELLVLSFPQDLQMSLDAVQTKNTPTLLTNLTESDHEIKLTKDGYKEKVIRIRTVKGYKLTMTVFLGVDPSVVDNTSSLNQSATKQASASATKAVTKVLILQTPTGFLRVRESASIAAAEVGRVNPGETYELVEESNGWFSIKLADGKIGWVSSQYSQKQ